MFCPHCGSESTGERNYCKHCGGNLNLVALTPARDAKAPITTGTALVVGASTLALVVIGFGLMLVAMSELRHVGLPPDVFKMLLVFGTLTILVSVISLSCLWAYLLGPARRAEGGVPLKAPAQTNELGPARPPAALPERHAASVVEHTTRTLEHARK